MRKLRNRRLTVRFTEEEFEKLMIQMQFAGFNSMSFYARSVLLEGRIRRRNLSKSTSNLTREITLLKSELRKIGVNYNQRVKALNTLAKLRDKNGRVIVNAADIDHDMMQMKRMMDGMVQKVNEIYAQVVEQ